MACVVLNQFFSTGAQVVKNGCSFTSTYPGVVHSPLEKNRAMNFPGIFFRAHVKRPEAVFCAAPKSEERRNGLFGEMHGSQTPFDGIVQRTKRHFQDDFCWP